MAASALGAGVRVHTALQAEARLEIHGFRITWGPLKLCAGGWSGFLSAGLGECLRATWQYVPSCRLGH